MWLVYEGDKDASGVGVLNLVVSLGVPRTIGRVHRRTWGVEYPDQNTAEDALWVLQRHASISTELMGEGQWALTDAPPEFTHTQIVHGRAEA